MLPAMSLVLCWLLGMTLKKKKRASLYSTYQVVFVPYVLTLGSLTVELFGLILTKPVSVIALIIPVRD